MMRATGPRPSMDSGYFFTFFFFSFVALLPSQAYSQPRLERFILFKLNPQRTFVILGCNEKKVWKSLLGRNVFNVFFDVCRLSRKVSRGLQSSLPDKWHSKRICVSCMRIKHCIICMFMVMKLGKLQRGLQKNKQWCWIGPQSCTIFDFMLTRYAWLTAPKRFHGLIAQYMQESFLFWAGLKKVNKKIEQRVL